MWSTTQDGITRLLSLPNLLCLGRANWRYAAFLKSKSDSWVHKRQILFQTNRTPTVTGFKTDTLAKVLRLQNPTLVFDKIAILSKALYHQNLFLIKKKLLSSNQAQLHNSRNMTLNFVRNFAGKSSKIRLEMSKISQKLSKVPQNSKAISLV